MLARTENDTAPVIAAGRRFAVLEDGGAPVALGTTSATDVDGMRGLGMRGLTTDWVGPRQNIEKKVFIPRKRRRETLAQARYGDGAIVVPCGANFDNNIRIYL